MRIDSSNLNIRVTILSRVEVEEDDGTVTVTWPTVVCSLWAERKPLRGVERFQALEMQNANMMSYLTRFDTRVTPEMRLVDGSAVYHITGVLPQGRKQWLLIDGTEVTGE